MVSIGSSCGEARQRFLDLQFKPGQWAINQRLIGIHCVGLEAPDFDRLAEAGGMVWSPLSNYLLYGEPTEAGLAIMAVAEGASRTVCEACGVPARPSRHGGWWRTRCAAHINWCWEGLGT